MSEKPKWYYVEKQERKGPVTLSSLRDLIAQGKTNEQTLVWKEGMKDWQPAGSIKGLIISPALESLPSDASKDKENQSGLPEVEASQKSKNLQRTSERSTREKLSEPGPVGAEKEQPVAAEPTPGDRPTPIPVVTGNEPLPSVSPTPSSTASPTVSSSPSYTPTASGFAVQTEPGRNSLSSRQMNSWIEKFKWVGYPCLFAGFMLVISAKGCDSLGNRWVNRLQAISQNAEARFNASYDRQRSAIEAKIAALNSSPDPDRQRISELRQQISDLANEQSKERSRLASASWQEMAISARMARANNQAWGFFRELAFVLGSMILSVGLLTLGITGNSSEKWTCLIMLAILTFSIYIGGFAWFSSIAGNISPNIGL